MNAFEWSEPRTVAEAVGQLGPTALAKAGGVELMDLLKERIIAPARLVSLQRVPGLDRVEDRAGEGMRIGPLVTLARLAEDAAVRARYRALAEAAGHAATPQIRNMATLGGNLLQRPRCWYFRSEQFVCERKGGDRCFAYDGENAYHAVFGHRVCCAVHPSSLACALVALGAAVELTGPRGARVVALEQFFVAPESVGVRDTVRADDEVLSGVVLPAPAAGASSAYSKQAQKQSYDWPLVEVAVNVERSGERCVRASIVLGAVAPTPWRARAAEAVLVGRAIDSASAREAGRAAHVGAIPLRDNGYKLPLVETAVRRAVLASAGQEGPDALWSAPNPSSPSQGVSP
jgi:xanthine dehydrogenase YagS FAD-binding subunit